MLAFDFRPGEPDLRLFPRIAWQRAIRAGINRLHATDLVSGPPFEALLGGHVSTVDDLRSLVETVPWASVVRDRTLRVLL